MDSLINLALIAALIFGVGSIAALVFFVSINRQPDIQKRIVKKDATIQTEEQAERQAEGTDVPSNAPQESNKEQS